MGVPTPNYREAGHLLSTYGQRLGMEGDDAGAQQALAIAMAIAQHEGDLTLEMVTLINSAWVDVHHLRLQESGEKSLRAIELMEQLDDPLHGWQSLLHVLRVHYNNGDMVEARRYATRLLTFAERRGDPEFLAAVLYACEKVALLSGDWTSARQFCDRGLTLAPQEFFLSQVRSLLEYAVGDFELGEAHLVRLIEAYQAAAPEPDWVYVNVPQNIGVIAHTTGASKYFEVAQAAAQIVLKSKRVSPLWVWFARTGLALMAAHLGDTKAVQEQYRAVRGQRGNFLAMDVNRLLGLLAAASGELGHAAAYFETALATWGKGRYPEYAWTAYDYADMLFRRGHPGDEDKAKHLLDEALSTSHELGMAPLTERVLLRKEGVNTQ